MLRERDLSEAQKGVNGVFLYPTLSLFIAEKNCLQEHI
jgi:hypothetical protein